MAVFRRISMKSGVYFLKTSVKLPSSINSLINVSNLAQQKQRLRVLGRHFFRANKHHSTSNVCPFVHFRAIFTKFGT